MKSGFRPRDRDRTTESMEGSVLGFGPLWRGVGLQRERGVSGYTVNHWSIKRPPNGTKLDRRSTGGVPRLLVKSRYIPRKFNTRSQPETKRGTPEGIGLPDCKTDNGENARMHETNTYAQRDAHDDII